MLLLDLSRDLLGDALLLSTVSIDDRSVLSSNIGPLSVQSGGVVHSVEELDQGRVVDLFIRSITNSESLRVLCRSGADLVAKKNYVRQGIQPSQ